MKSMPLDNTHGRPTSGVACHHRLKAAHTVERRRAWHDITALRQNTLSNDVGSGMPSSHMGSTHSGTTSGIACHHHLWAAQTVERRRAWHEITALGLHRRLDDDGCGMTSLPLDSTHGRQLRAWHDITALGQHTRSATSGMASHHRPWLAHTVKRRRPWHEITALGQHTLSNDVGRGMPSSPLGIRHDRTMSGVSCHHRL